MCLGADVELTVVPTSGYPFAPHGARASGNGRAATRQSRDEDASSDSDSEDDLPLAASILKSGKSKKPEEPMFFTLVHGDTLVLSGDDFEVSRSCRRLPRPLLKRVQYTMHRTGMSIGQAP